jgi:hypothetical protein
MKYLHHVYDEIKGDIISFLNLRKLAKAAGMNAQHVANVLKIANDHLPSVEYRCEKLKSQPDLKSGNPNSARTFQDLSDLISTTHNTLEQYESDCKEKRLEITILQIQKIEAETIVKDFQKNDETYPHSSFSNRILPIMV